MLPMNLSVAQLTYVIRRRLKMKAESTILIFSESHVISGQENVSDVFLKYIDKEDGFLYLTYTLENTFG